MGELRRLTSPTEMLTLAPAALCNGSTLRRAVLSLVSGGRMTAHSAHFDQDPEGAARGPAVASRASARCSSTR